MSEKYDHKVIEKKCQDVWSASGVYSAGENSVKPKKYVLDMFPYPSGDGLHVGHPKGYIATDIYSRMKRMQGFNVLHPMGWDAFGLPAEQYAIKNKVHPRVAVEKNTKRYKEQLSMIGFDYDWSREINTTDPTFYKWTQWIFLKMFKMVNANAVIPQLRKNQCVSGYFVSPTMRIACLLILINSIGLYLSKKHRKTGLVEARALKLILLSREARKKSRYSRRASIRFLVRHIVCLRRSINSLMS